MNIRNIKRRKTTKSRLITIRVTPDVSRWLKRKDYSPTGIFNEALKELGYKKRYRKRKVR